MEGRVTDSSYYFSYPRDCGRYFLANRSCIYEASKTFELSPAPSVLLTLSDVLQSQTIVEALTELDPSFYFLTSTLSSSYHNNYNSRSTYKSDYAIRLMIDRAELNNPVQLDRDVTDALYVTLSWVSY